MLVTCTCNPIPKAGIDYFPLTIEFEESPNLNLSRSLNPSLNPSRNRNPSLNPSRWIQWTHT